MRNPKSKFLVAIVLLLLVGGILWVHAWWIHRGPQPGTVLDEARQAHRSADSFPAAADDYFHDMDQDKDGVVQLSPEEIKGRNTWIVWTGGDDHLWNRLTNDSFGALDFLKTLSPMGTISEVSDVVDAVVYLTEARQVTGEVLHVDGGAHSSRW